ncbi:MAG: phosphonopyruvate decarboxylase [Alphaproteobacteria bacterium]|jgi:sulfopyruvate decarboxylase alpha subunit|nr:phosphonopyruvate decarboxylase [Alphaproteobacteria bacterium]MBT4086247.1 phosphonopyruvate decarboxylase [Alphaproteobacteria bacterium]MBT4543864.1 phosphonopyruvate decarboxylase [Alphaproteobacteria bacterium]MBT7744875.1 phosphonopyruvate decarboxylase [Alphaproteobacteria bacterium]
MENRSATWPDDVYASFKAHDVRQLVYVPDAGHARLIELAIADPDMEATPLTSEEEGIALLAGAWLGGQKGVLLMQSSGVGNCINMLSLTNTCRFPLLTLITMRGEWAEFNPWQGPMSKATKSSLENMGVQSFRVEDDVDVAPTVDAVATQVFAGDQAAAILLGQKLIGKKEWSR